MLDGSRNHIVIEHTKLHKINQYYLVRDFSLWKCEISQLKTAFLSLCRITSPMLLFAISMTSGACYFITRRRGEKLILAGWHFTSTSFKCCLPSYKNILTGVNLVVFPISMNQQDYRFALWTILMMHYFEKHCKNVGCLSQQTTWHVV